jgi:hypothetical protein
MSLLLFLTHYIRYYNIKRRITCGSRPCDNSSLLKAEEDFHTRDVDSSSWYLKPDHDVIMTLSEIREGLPFQLISRHVKSHQDDERDYADLTRPEQLNVEADHRATAALDALRAAKQTTEFYPLPPAEPISATPPDISPVAKYARSEPNFLSTNFEHTFKTQQLV